MADKTITPAEELALLPRFEKWAEFAVKEGSANEARVGFLLENVPEMHGDMRRQGEALGLFSSYMDIYRTLRTFVKGTKERRMAVGGFGGIYPRGVGFTTHEGRLYTTMISIDMNCVSREFPDGLVQAIHVHPRYEPEDSVPYEGPAQMARRIFPARDDYGFAVAIGPEPLAARHMAMAVAYGTASSLWTSNHGEQNLPLGEEGRLLFFPS